MDRILIAGIDSVVGANLAAWFGDRADVVGLSFAGHIAIAGCKTACCPQDEPEAIRSWVAAERPQWLIYCGPAARSAWDPENTIPPEFLLVQWSRAWARAAEEFGCRLTAVSSDAVFTGPWMFHDEESAHFCNSPAAQAVRAMEQDLLAHCGRSLVVRTNVFGWSPLPGMTTLVQRVLSEECGEEGALDCVRHSTPILATDLAEILAEAARRELRGLYHGGGAERINPHRFAALLADQFGCRYTTPADQSALTERRAGFGCGETSLRSRKIREELAVSLPLLSDGIARLYEQSLNGFRDRLGSSPAGVQDLVA